MNPNTDDLKNTTEFDLVKKLDGMQKMKDSPKKIVSTQLYTYASFPFRQSIYHETFKKLEQRYTLLKDLGEGGMGIVQLVRDELLGREVALKSLRLKTKRTQNKEKYLLWRLQREAEIMALLEHPNILPLYDLEVKEDGEIQFTMKKVEGKTLRDLWKTSENSKDEERKSLEILLKVCDGIRYAHSKGIIHRDLKPENIMIGNYGEVYILDWGIAKKIGENEFIDPLEKEKKHYETIGGVGTPGYMPPEQQENATKVKEQADIYTLGKILREGYLKFSPWEELKARVKSLKLKETTKDENLQNVLEEREKEIPKEVKAIIRKATAEKEEERYDSVESFTTDIRNYLKDMPVSVQEYRLDELFYKWAKRHRHKLLILGFISILGVTFLGFWKWQNEKQYQDAHQKAQKKQKTAEAIQSESREKQETKTKQLLEALNSTDQALRYKPGNYESEMLKVQLLEAILPLCYQEEDYQLASFLVDGLQTLVHFSDKKQILNKEVKEKKVELLKQHLSTLSTWEKKYKSLETQEQVEQGERDDFVFEVSKMREIEVLEQLLQWLEKGTQLFIQEQLVPVSELNFYQDVVKTLGRLGNQKANNHLRYCLKELWMHLTLLEEKIKWEDVQLLKKGRLPQTLEEFLKNILSEQGKSIEAPYYLKKTSELSWKYIDEQKEAHFTLLFSPENISLSIYNAKKELNTDYHQFMREIVIALSYLRDQNSVNLLLDMDSSSKISFNIEHPLKKLLKNFSFPLPQNVEDYFKQGLPYLYLKDYEKAIVHYTQMIDQYPDHFGAYSHRGLAKKDKKDLEGAITDFTEAIRLNPQSANTYMNRGLTKHEKNDIEGAIADYTEAIQLNPQSAQTYSNRGFAKIDKKDFEGAISDCTQALHFNPQYAEAYLNRGIAKYEKKDLEGAISDFTEALRLDPQSAQAYANRGFAKTDKKDFEGAISDCTQAIRFNPQSAQSYANRGFVKFQKKDFDGAIADYTEALRLFPQSDETYINRGVVKYEKNDIEGALHDYTKAIQLNPQSAQAYSNRGFAKIDKKDFEGAISDCTQAIAINPQYEVAYNNRGLAKHEKKDLNAAIADYTEAIRLNPQFALAYTNRGNARRENKELTGAIADYTEALHLNPESANIYTNRGLAKLQKKDLDGAIADFTEALHLNPQYVIAYSNRGLAKHEKKDLNGAIADFTEAIHLNPQSVASYINRGMANYDKNDLEGAIADFTEALQLNPQSANSFFGRGLAKYQKQDLEGAIADFTEAVRINPQFAKAYVNRGNAKKDKNDLEGAIADYTEAIRINPEYADAYNNRGALKKEQQDLEGAITDFTKAIQLTPQDAYAYYNRGFVKGIQQEIQEAIEDFETGLSLQSHPMAQTMLLDLLKYQLQEQMTKKEWNGAKINLLKLKKYLPLDDPQQQDIDQKIQQLDTLLESNKKK